MSFGDILGRLSFGEPLAEFENRNQNTDRQTKVRQSQKQESSEVTASETTTHKRKGGAAGGKSGKGGCMREVRKSQPPPHGMDLKNQ